MFVEINKNINYIITYVHCPSLEHFIVYILYTIYTLYIHYTISKLDFSNYVIYFYNISHIFNSFNTCIKKYGII